MYQKTNNPNTVIRLVDGACIPRGHRWWSDYEAWIASGNSPEPAPDMRAADARAQRDALLAACDWTQAADSPLDATTKAAWASYRAALRNVPQQAAFPSVVTWPTAPGS